MIPEIEKAALDVIDAHDAMPLPVDIEKVAGNERIESIFIQTENDFFGRIEYLKEFKKFVIYRPAPNSLFPNPVHRFSFAHELGHYFLNEHRRLLIQGRSHYSKPGFIHNNLLEKEADYFAGAFLIPASYLKSKLNGTSAVGITHFQEISRECNTSLTSAAIRYVNYANECCGVVVSREHTVNYYIPSDDAVLTGFQYLGKNVVPPNSATLDAHNGKDNEMYQRGCPAETWFLEPQKTGNIWEEAVRLGSTGLVLTFLTLAVDKNDED